MDDKKIGNFIRELREEENISQAALAKKMYVANSVVSRWESGKAGVSADNLVLLSNIFHVSLDELVAGHRFGKKSKQKSNDVWVGVLNSRQKLKRYIKRLIHLIIILLIIFLGYFFYTFYNSIQIYTIHMDTNEYNIRYGMLTKTRDRIYFHLDVDYNGNVDDIESVSLYYLNSERKDIVKSNTLTSINFIDYYGYEEYIDFKNFNKIINNMYFEVKYKDNNVEKYKLTFERNYANIDFFLKKEHKIDEDGNNKNETNVTGKIDEKIEKVRSALEENSGIMNIKYDGVDYQLFLDADGFRLYFVEDGIEKFYIYDNQEYEIFAYKTLIKNEWNYVYSMNLTDDSCVSGDCQNFKKDYEKFVKVIDF